jgi:hypothetical protein
MVRQISMSWMVVLLLATAAPATASGDEWPRKIASIKVGAGLFALEGEAADEACGSTVGALGQFGLDFAAFPWTLKTYVYTDVSIELFGGAFLPAFRLGDGWVAFTAGAGWRSTRVDRPATGADCATSTTSSVENALFAGGSAEYLLYGGNLGFQLDVRQAVVGVQSTWVGLGVDVSPLIWLIWRNQ